jgi:hypothetical protein
MRQRHQFHRHTLLRLSRLRLLVVPVGPDIPDELFQQYLGWIRSNCNSISRQDVYNPIGDTLNSKCAAVS